MKRTFKLTVFDKAGTLNRLTSTFVRRQFNIINLTVTQTLEPGISDITFVAEVSDNQSVNTIIQQLKKQVNTLTVEDVTDTNIFNRALLLIKVKKTDTLESLNQALQPYDALVSLLKEDNAYYYLQACGPQDTLDTLIDNLSSFGIEQVSRTGSASIS
ncbi:acetolactate synthase small subunit [Staphylococcus sp. 17KM0847]|uniref:acetolactate synthase small subunit n=1 Tax=Staphylococcus sp. 17KM0847 TaxID=2583989 RepID=UPI0015DCA578|nr:acetolactate synthase small subunit [Staphylococcus sp. 17KM0847]QLK86470.1 acetolactate synthase small subunit [Staphylococcus sp. 17KM0847]